MGEAETVINSVSSAAGGSIGLGVIFDVIVVVVLLICAIVAAKKGFIESIFGLLTTIVSLVAAVFLAKILVEVTGGLFGLSNTIRGGVIDFLSGIEGLDTDISKQGLAVSLEGKLPAFVIDLIVDAYGVDVPANTTIAMQLATPVTDFVMFIVAGIIIFIAAKLALGIVKNIIISIIGVIGLLNAVDKLLGFVLGVVQGALIVGALFMLISFLPIEGLTTMIDSSIFAHMIYHNNPLQIVAGLIIG